MPKVQVITAPNPILVTDPYHKVFLAGGITGCPDWQAKAIQLIRQNATRDIVLYNPRRPNFPIDDPSAAPQQIEWEFKALNHADTILFWFCKEAIQPIALYELGRHAYRFSKGHFSNLLVGVEPGYPREQDVRIQLDLACGAQPFDDLKTLLSWVY
jgi:hypothetical protein